MSVGALAGPALLLLATPALAAAPAIAAASVPDAAAYRAITPSMADKTVLLSGRDLTVDQVVQVARYGAKVSLSAEARQRSADAYGLLLEAAAEGVSVYWFNRGSGSGRRSRIRSTCWPRIC